MIADDGRILAESGAIIEYLVDRHGAGSGLRPAPGTDAALRHAYWLHYAEGSAMPLLLTKLIFARLPQQVPLLVRPVAAMIARGVQARLTDPQLQDHVAFWNAELARDGWFAGPDFTAADIAMSFPVEAAGNRVTLPPSVNLDAIRRYLAAIRARPAYLRALERGGAYVFATSRIGG